MFLSARSIPSTIQDILLQKSTVLKVETERVPRKGKRVVQSCGQAQVTLVLVQSHNSSRDRYQCARTAPTAS